MSADELRSLAELVAASPLSLFKGQQPYRPDEPVTRAYCLASGWAVWQEVLEDGTSQVYDFPFAGDVIGLEAIAQGDELARRGAARGEPVCHNLFVTALTPLVVIPILPAAFAALRERHPGLALLLLTLLSQERTKRLRRHLRNAGGRNAHARTADFLIELWERQGAAGSADQCRFELPATQSVLGEALGLAPTYLCRILSSFVAEEILLIEKNGQRMVTVLDADRLRAIARSEERETTFNPPRSRPEKVSIRLGSVAADSRALVFRRPGRTVDRCGGPGL